MCCLPEFRIVFCREVFPSVELRKFTPMLHLPQHLSSTLINIEKIKNPFIDAVRCCKQLLNMTFLIRDLAKNNPENVILDS